MDWVNPKYARLVEYVRTLQADAPRGKRRGPRPLGAATVINEACTPYTVTYGQPGKGGN